MKKLDWYITRKFLGTYVFMIMAVMSIAIVIDISEKLRQFTNSKVELTIWQIATEYYPYFFLHYANLFSSLIIFLAVLMFTSLMAQRSEIIAILSNGVSFLRFTRPYIIVSTFLLVFTLFMNHYFVPFANKKRLEFESKYTPVVGSFKDMNLQMDDTTIVHFNSLDAKNNNVYRLWIETWQPDQEGMMQMKRDVMIHTAHGDSSTNTWELNNVFVRTFTDSNETIEKFEHIDTVLSFNVKDLGQRDNIMESMTTKELWAYRNRQKKRGAGNVANIEVIVYERTAYPFAVYILTLIGVAVSSRKSREGVGKHLIVGLSASVAYIFFMKMTTVAATNVGLAPMIAVWVPNAIFAVIAAFLYIRRIKE